MHPSSEPPCALLVDDDSLSLQSLGMLLEVMGWISFKTSRSEEVLHQIKERTFDLVIVDLRMPETSGLEICRQIRSQNLGKQPIIFILSGYVDAKSHAEAESLGAQAILHKPIGLDDLKALFKKFQLPCKI